MFWRMQTKEISLQFAQAAEQPHSVFSAHLAQHFLPEGVAFVRRTLAHLGLPEPRSTFEFRCASGRGAILFINALGLVVRIEPASTCRVDDSPFVLRPIGALECGGVRIEFIPGCRLAGDDVKTYNLLCDRLKKQNIDFYDPAIFNVGLLPVRTPEFPNGLPVVIDRLSVRRLPNEDGDVLPVDTGDFDYQDYLYSDIRHSFEECWREGILNNPDPKAIERFLKLCQRSVKTGLLVPGWKVASEDISNEQVREIALGSNVCAKYYERACLSL